MNWTTEKPTREGWYWYRGGIVVTGLLNEREPIMLAVAMLDGVLKAMLMNGSSFTVACLNGQFAGPLEPPT